MSGAVPAVPAEVKKLIESSGNNFHSKTARWFQEHGWLVTVSPYYMDSTQEKAREIDLVVVKSWDVGSRFTGHLLAHVVLRLYVECKFVPTYSVFWFASKDTHAAKELICRDGVFRENNSYTNKHHYLARSPRVAKMFATSSQGSPENEPFYKAINQALSANIAMRFTPTRDPRIERSGASINVFDFPVVVCSSFEKLWATGLDSDEPTTQITDNFQVETRFAYMSPSSGTHQNDYFLVDFVEFAQLDAFVATLEETANMAKFFLGDN